jgi:hypothetical protein
MERTRLRRAALVFIGSLALAGVVAGPASAGKKDVVCKGTLEKLGEVTGSVKHDVIVPANQVCSINNAKVGHDVILEAGSFVGISSSTIKHSVIGKEVSTLETGNVGPNAGPVSVGHDIELTGIQSNAEHANGYVICDTTIKHDLLISGTSTPFGTIIGDTGTASNEFCTGGPMVPTPQDMIGHNLVIKNNVFGRLDVGNNTIRHDLIVENNIGTTAFGDAGTLDVSDNAAGHNALCAGNTPALTPDGPEDGPNHAKKLDTCP